MAQRRDRGGGGVVFTVPLGEQVLNLLGAGSGSGSRSELVRFRFVLWCRAALTNNDAQNTHTRHRVVFFLSTYYFFYVFFLIHTSSRFILVVWLACPPASSSADSRCISVSRPSRCFSPEDGHDRRKNMAGVVALMLLFTFFFYRLTQSHFVS